MQVTLSDLKVNVGKYVDLAETTDDITIEMNYAAFRGEVFNHLSGVPELMTKKSPVQIQ